MRFIQKVQMICPAIKKIDKLPCTYKVTHNGFCGKHQKFVEKYVIKVPDKFACKVCLDDNLHSSMVVCAKIITELVKNVSIGLWLLLLAIQKSCVVLRVGATKNYHLKI